VSVPLGLGGVPQRAPGSRDWIGPASDREGPRVDRVGPGRTGRV